MRSTFEIENINWMAVVLISAIMFIGGFTFFDEWMATLFAAISILAVSYVTGRSRGRVSKIIDVRSQEIVVGRERK